MKRQEVLNKNIECDAGGPERDKIRLWDGAGWCTSIDGQVQCPSPSTIATELAGIPDTMSSLITTVRTSMSTIESRNTVPITKLLNISEFLEAIRSVNPPGRWKILVVDEHSQALLSSVLKQFDILEENVTRA